MFEAKFILPTEVALLVFALSVKHMAALNLSGVSCLKSIREVG